MVHTTKIKLHGFLNSSIASNGISFRRKRSTGRESCQCQMFASLCLFCHPSPSLHRIPFFQPPHLNQPMNQTNPRQDFPFSAGEAGKGRHGTEARANFGLAKRSRNRRIAPGGPMYILHPTLHPFPSLSTFIAIVTPRGGGSFRN